MINLEELLELTEFLEKDSKDVNMSDISQVISFLKKYIDCQNKIINAFKENYDEKTIELSKYKQAIEILKDTFRIEICEVDIFYSIECEDTFSLLKNKEEYELLKEVLGNE